MKAFAPAESEEDKQAYALNLYRKLFQIEPTTMLINMIKDPQVPLLNDAIGGNVAAVLEKQPEFNIKTTSIYDVINNEEAFKEIPVENQETVKTQLKTLQRITAISPDPDVLPVLYNTKLHWLWKFPLCPIKQSMTVMSKSGLDEDNTKPNP